MLTVSHSQGRTARMHDAALEHLVTVPRARVVVYASSREQADVTYRALVEAALERNLEARAFYGLRELRHADGGRLQVLAADEARLAAGAPITLALGR